MLFKKLINGLIILLVFCFLGCASISNGTLEGTKSFLFTSTPSGADVTINSIPYGKTPCKVQLAKYEHFRAIVLKKDGYKDSVANIKKGFNTATLGNVIAGGGIGLGFDVLSGNFISTKNSVHVNLEPSYK